MNQQKVYLVGYDWFHDGMDIYSMHSTLDKAKVAYKTYDHAEIYEWILDEKNPGGVEIKDLK